MLKWRDKYICTAGGAKTIDIGYPVRDIRRRLVNQIVQKRMSMEHYGVSHIEMGEATYAEYICEYETGMFKPNDFSDYYKFCGVPIAVNLHSPNKLKLVMK